MDAPKPESERLLELLDEPAAWVDDAGRVLSTNRAWREGPWAGCRAVVDGERGRSGDTQWVIALRDGARGRLAVAERPRRSVGVDESCAAPPVATEGTERVLLVEDDEGIRTVTRLALERRGYTVRCAASVAEGLAALGAELPDLLITDGVLPDGEGAHLVAALHERDPGVPVLFVSGWDAGIARGVASAFLRKPFSPVQLAAKVRQVLDRARPAGFSG